MQDPQQHRMKITSIRVSQAINKSGKSGTGRDGTRFDGVKGLEHLWDVRNPIRSTTVNRRVFSVSSYSIPIESSSCGGFHDDVVPSLLSFQ